MILSSRKGRSTLFQTLALLLTVCAFGFLAHTTATNLERQGIASGFGFFGKSAGFDIIQHLIPYDEQSTYGMAFLVALVNTLVVSVLGVFFATILGFVIGVARLSSNFLLSRLALTYIEVVRNIPLLLQLFFWYFAVLRSLPVARESHAIGKAIFLNMRGLYLPAPRPEPGLWAFLGVVVASVAAAGFFIRWARKRQLATGQILPSVRISLVAVPVLGAAAYFALGRPLAWELPELRGFNFVGGLTLIPELVSLLLALTIYTAAFIAEIVRAGILSVNHGQTEAALALGLTRGQMLRLVVIPQAMRVILPPMTSQYLNLTKNSSLAAAIAYPDLVLVFAGTVLMQTGQAVEVIATTMMVYLAISLLISFSMNRYSRSVALVER